MFIDKIKLTIEIVRVLEENHMILTYVAISDAEELVREIVDKYLPSEEDNE